MSTLREILKSKNSDYYDIFKSNIVKVKPILKKCTPIDFTFHGLDHCKKLERYTNELIPVGLKEKLNAIEIFVLLNGIYYHDIGMISHKAVKHEWFDSDNKKQYIVELLSQRNEHNVISKEMIYDEEENTYNKELITLPDSDVNFANSISMLCEGHRNYKVQDSKTGEVSIVKTLEKIPPLQNYQDEEIHTRTLACILRIADELDITSQRAPSDVLIHLKTFISEYSVKEWVNHQLFGRVEINPNLFFITLHPNIIKIKARDKELQDRTKTRNLLFSKLSKIDIELANVEEALEKSNVDVLYNLGYQKAKIKYDETLITKDDKEKYDKERNKSFIYESRGLESDPLNSNVKGDVKIYKPDEINYKAEFLKGVQNLDKLRKLVSVGFFELPSNLYSKYYLHTNEIISNKDLLNNLTSYLKSELNEIEYDYILGIDKTGIIIGSNLSIKSGKDFTYNMFSKKENEYAIEFEEFVSDKMIGKKIVIITDVIASGSTIKTTINQCVKRYKVSVSAICSIFSVSQKNLDKLKLKFKVPFIILSNHYSFDTYTLKQIESNIKLKNEFELLTKAYKS